jgi:hypothetical protein
MIQRYLGTTVYGMRCKYVDTKSLPYNTLSRYHMKKRRTYGLTLSPYHIKKTTDQGDAPSYRSLSSTIKGTGHRSQQQQKREREGGREGGGSDRLLFETLKLKICRTVIN